VTNRGLTDHKGEKTLAELVKLHDVHANQIMDWKNQLLGGAGAIETDVMKDQAAKRKSVAQ